MSEADSIIPVLLHPQMDSERRTEWMLTQGQRHHDWQLRAVAPEELADRLAKWFPYLTGVFEDDGGSFLPPLVEITTTDVASLDTLETSPAVIAIGPRSSVHQAIGGAARHFAVLLAIVSAVLLSAAAALAAVWVHLEVYRHSAEITIMRLIGATESAIRGPFLLGVTVPGVAAGLISCLGTFLFVEQASRLTSVVGLPAIEMNWQVIALQNTAGCLLPLLAGMITLSRHAYLEMDG